MSVASRVRSAVELCIADPAAFVRKATRRTLLAAGLPRNPVRTVSAGGVSLELDLRDPMQRSMYAETYETAEVALVRRLVRPGDTVFDVGAHAGYFTWLAASCVGTEGEIHAFEPVPELYRRLQRLAARNPRHRIHACSRAAGEASARLPLSLSADGNEGWNTLVPGFMPPDQLREQVVVEVQPLDAYIEDRGVARVDFVKIDTEGYELSVLRGMRGCLRDHRPWVLCEVAPTAFPFQRATPDDFHALLASARYRACTLDLAPVRIHALTRTANVLLAPEERAEIPRRRA